MTQRGKGIFTWGTDELIVQKNTSTRQTQQRWVNGYAWMKYAKLKYLQMLSICAKRKFPIKNSNFAATDTLFDRLPECRTRRVRFNWNTLIPTYVHDKSVVKNKRESNPIRRCTLNWFRLFIARMLARMQAKLISFLQRNHSASLSQHRNV